MFFLDRLVYFYYMETVVIIILLLFDKYVFSYKVVG